MALEQRPHYVIFTARLLQASFNFMFLSLGLKQRGEKVHIHISRGYFLKTTSG